MKDKFFLIVGLVAFLLTAAMAQQTEPAAHQRLRVSQGVMAGLLIHRVEPEYPEEAKAQKITGSVIVTLQIDKEGSVAQAAIVSGHPLFVQPAIDAVKQWQFKPYLLNGEAIEVETTATLNFGAPTRVRVSQGVMDSMSKSKVDPAYPVEAKAKRIQGDVILQVIISKEGDISDLKVVSGHPLVAEAAIKAVKQWTYAPYTIQGQPVEVETTVRVQFRM